MVALYTILTIFLRFFFGQERELGRVCGLVAAGLIAALGCVLPRFPHFQISIVSLFYKQRQTRLATLHVVTTLNYYQFIAYL